MLGVLSSFHCVGMCGPLMMALPVKHLSGQQQSIALLLYHAGRIVVYMTLGFLFGSMGWSLYMAGWQQYFSIVLGVVMLSFAAYYFLFKNAPQPSFLKRIHSVLQAIMGKALRSGRLGAFMILGMCNGFLPCGMVYLAIAGALTSNEVAHGAVFMGAFGIGTLPVLILLSVFSYRVSLPVRNSIKKLVPGIVVVMAVILILRGMNLGIPFISPIVPETPKGAIFCH